MGKFGLTCRRTTVMVQETCASFGLNNPISLNILYKKLLKHFTII